MPRRKDFPPVPKIIGKTPYYSVQYYDDEGKRRWISTGQTKYHDAKNIIMEWIDEETQSIKPIKKSLKLKDCFSDIFTEKDRPATISGYQYMIDRIGKKPLGEIEILKITARDINNFLDDMFKTLNDKSQESYHKVFKAIIGRVDKREKSKIQELVPQVKKAGKTVKSLISKKEFYLILDEFTKNKKKDEFRLAFLLGHLAGLRVGELTALRPENILVHKDKYHILISHTYDSETKKFVSLENDSSFRYLPIPNSLGAELTERCFDLSRGSRIFSKDQNRYTKEIQEIMLTLKISKRITFHMGRDFISTYFRESCAPYSLELFLGHTVGEVQGIYSHKRPGQFPDEAKYQEAIIKREIDLDFPRFCRQV